MPTAAVALYSVSGIGRIARVELVLQPRMSMIRTILDPGIRHVHNT